MMRDLDHGLRECPGQWVRAQAEGRTVWRCSRCAAAYPQDPEVSEAVAWEYHLALLLFILSAQGHRLLNPALGGPPG
jgi:hypothetical protein